VDHSFLPPSLEVLPLEDAEPLEDAGELAPSLFVSPLDEVEGPGAEGLLPFFFA
jgi:hypothetical protein